MVITIVHNIGQNMTQNMEKLLYKTQDNYSTKHGKTMVKTWKNYGLKNQKTR